MTRIVLILTCAVATLGTAGVASAQPKQKFAPQPTKLHYNPPSYYVQPPAPAVVTPTRPSYGSIDCSPTIGFYGDIARRGLLVTHVTRRSEASRIGLVAGDVIIEADGRRINSQRDWDRAIDRAGREICLTVQRANGRVVDLHARLSHDHRHGHSQHVSRPVTPVVPVTPIYMVPQPPQTAYHFSFGDGGFRIGLTVRD